MMQVYGGGGGVQGSIRNGKAEHENMNPSSASCQWTPGSTPLSRWERRQKLTGCICSLPAVWESQPHLSAKADLVTRIRPHHGASLCGLPGTFVHIFLVGSYKIKIHAKKGREFHSSFLRETVGAQKEVGLPHIPGPVNGKAETRIHI